MAINKQDQCSCSDTAENICTSSEPTAIDIKPNLAELKSALSSTDLSPSGQRPDGGRKLEDFEYSPLKTSTPSTCCLQQPTSSEPTDIDVKPNLADLKSAVSLTKLIPRGQKPNSGRKFENFSSSPLKNTAASTCCLPQATSTPSDNNITGTCGNAEWRQVHVSIYYQ